MGTTTDGKRAGLLRCTGGLLTVNEGGEGVTFHAGRLAPGVWEMRLWAWGWEATATLRRPRV